MTPAVAVVIVAYDNGDDLLECVESVLEHDGDAEVIVVVNGDAHGAAAQLAGQARVQLVHPGRNLGFAGGCNVGVTHARGDVVLFLNPDALVRPGALEALARAANTPGVGLVMPRLRLRAEPDLLNSAGGTVHLSGLGWASGYRQPARDVQTWRDVAAASGAAMAVRRDTFLALGGFLEELFAYHEDAELSWRAHLQGLRVVLVPDADVVHAYEFSRHPAKYELLERNRLIFVLTLYSGRLLALLAPVLVAYEVAIVAVAARQGWLAAKTRGWTWCWHHRAWLATRRHAVQAERRVGDREMSRFLAPVLDPAQLGLPRGVGVLNTCLSGYWSVARRLL